MTISTRKRRRDNLAQSRTSHKISRLSGSDDANDYCVDEKCCRELTELVKTQRFVTVSGTDGSGHVELVKKVANEVFPQFAIIYLYVSDQWDAKSLYGGYKSSGIPGDFIWSDSQFSKLIQQPETIIVLKGLESASADVISSILQLFDEKRTSLPGGRTVRLNSDIRLLGLVTLNDDLAAPTSYLLKQYPYNVLLPELSRDQAAYYASKRFGLSTQLCGIYYDGFDNVRNLIARYPSSERKLMIRDFFVACRRIASSEQNPTVTLLNLVESWILHLSKVDYTLEPLSRLSNLLSLNDREIKYVQSVRDIEIRRVENTVHFGRVSLEALKNEIFQQASNYALTKDCRNLLERIAVCVKNSEPVLLNGETGVGKTQVVQKLAASLNVKLLTVNLSLDSDASGIIGGFKPGNTKLTIRRYLASFEKLLSTSPDHNILRVKLAQCFAVEDYLSLVEIIMRICLSASSKISQNSSQWCELYAMGWRLKNFLISNSGLTPFYYANGVMMQAICEGHWLLVDEINMASVECLNTIASVLDQRENELHPNFRLFACMNPATDSGKRKLPDFIRSKFTEFFVGAPQDRQQLIEIARRYVSHTEVEPLVDAYLAIISKFPRKFSLRNFCRSLMLAEEDAFGDRKYSLYSAFELGFSSCGNGVADLGDVMAKFMGRTPHFVPRPLSKTDVKSYVLIEGVRFPRGPNPIIADDEFLITESVSANLRRIAYGASNGRFPILLEGETSAGKTSMLTHLARCSGNKLHRINNHEHTDIQEYIGSYVANEENQLVFQSGILLDAVRSGEWVLLDELNLAPTEVLEALNRLLDDNRELYVAELDEVICPHPNFRLFATQNPVGTYAGRKRLSRAFLNRFIILDIVQPPRAELTQIVCTRCSIHETAANLMLEVMYELKSLRSTSGLFASGDALMTLRDLFRWGQRLSAAPDGADWRQIFADQGFLLLAGRCRRDDDVQKVRSVLTKFSKRTIIDSQLFSSDSPYFPQFVRNALNNEKGIVFTSAMKRMIVLCWQSFEANEPVLLVGETGCGKTSVAYLLAQNGIEFLNCHQRTDASDLLGRIRPVDGGLFRWEDGVVVRSMRNGKLLLLDEISLAQDSVLERLNSLFESTRTIVLNDMGAKTEVISAAPNFQCISTMNPGGDHGKKELSKALRNRFTEIWCHSKLETAEAVAILEARINKFSDNAITDAAKYSDFFAQYFHFFDSSFGYLFKSTFSIRDLVTTAELFYYLVINSGQSHIDAAYQTLCAVVFDSLPVLPSRTTKIPLKEVIATCEAEFGRLISMLNLSSNSELNSSVIPNVELHSEAATFGPFKIPFGPVEHQLPSDFSFSAPTVAMNAMRVARAMATTKPILLEGSPGVGKSSLISSMAELTGNSLIRLNLSEQTEVSDLFGADVPVTLPNGDVTFQWRDGPVLKAIKEGCWLLLDEMNLAPQPILEALNSCFDFRNSIYVAELNRVFEIDTKRRCRFFACQNPTAEGGNRKSLPKSFLNRFNKIYFSPMGEDDVLAIVEHMVSEDRTVALRYLRLHNSAREQLSDKIRLNLRDLIRLIICSKAVGIDSAFSLIYLSRISDMSVRKQLTDVFCAVMERRLEDKAPFISVVDRADDCEVIDFGNVVKMKRPYGGLFSESECRLLASEMTILRDLAICAECNFLALLSGPSHCGKRASVELLAQILNKKLTVMRMTPDSDALDLLGTYEQFFSENEVKECVDKVMSIARDFCTDPQHPHLATKLKILENLTSVCEIQSVVSDICRSFEKTEYAEEFKAISIQLETKSLHFEWVNSEFVKAFMEGRWLLIEDVNVCSSAVLDRLNNCLEQNGDLVLTENGDGEFRSIRRHPDFRVFFTMNPQMGNLSPAMRNRSIEIAFAESQIFMNSTADKARLWNTFELEPLLASKSSTVAAILPADVNEFLKTCSSTVEEKRKQIDIDWSSALPLTNSSNISEKNSSIESAISLFFENGWIYALNDENRPLIFLYGRLSGGLNTQSSINLLELDGNLNQNLKRIGLNFCQTPISPDYSFFGCTNQNPNDAKPFLLHLWFYAVWSFNTQTSDENSLFAASKEFLKESSFAEPSTASIFCRLYWTMLTALTETEGILKVSSEMVNPVQPISFQEFFKIVLLCSTFDRCVRNHWNQSLSEVTILNAVSEFISLNVAAAFKSKRLAEEINQLVSLTKVRGRPENWTANMSLPSTFVGVPSNARELVAMKTKIHSLFTAVDIPNGICQNVVEKSCAELDKLWCLLEWFIQDESHSKSLPLDAQCVLAFPHLEEEFRKLFVEYLVLTQSFTFIDFRRTVADFSQNGIVTGLILNLWSGLGFRPEFSSFSIAELSLLPHQLGVIQSFLWKFLHYQSRIRCKIQKRIPMVPPEFKNTDGYPMSLIRMGIERMKSHAPTGAVDPLLKKFAQTEINEIMRNVISEHYTVLRRYLVVVFNRDDFLSSNVHPFIEFLNIQKKLLDEWSVANPTSTYDLWRPDNSKYRKLGQIICEFISNAERFSEQLECSSISQYIDRIREHRLKLIQSYYQYPDVILPHLFGICEYELGLSLHLSKTTNDAQRQMIPILYNSPSEWLQSYAVERTRPDVENLAVRLEEDANLPPFLQYEIVIDFLSGRRQSAENTKTVIKWIQRKWAIWYENHTEKRQKMFEYRSTNMRSGKGNDEEEDTMPDPEMEEIRALLPDYSNAQCDSATPQQLTAGIDDDQLLNVLSKLVTSESIRKGNLKQNFFKQVEPYLPIIFSLSSARLCEEISMSTENLLSVSHLIAIDELKHSLLNVKEDVDVYQSADIGEVAKCGKELNLLNVKISQLLETFPESVVLSDISKAVKQFVSVPSGCAQLYFTSLLEKLLEKCELWDSNTARDFKIADEMRPMRERLLEWRKAELSSWGHILKRVSKKLDNDCVLTAFPLIESFLNTENSGEQFHRNLMAMLLEWLNNSSLHDLSSRLRICDLIAILLRCSENNSELIKPVESAMEYFRQFVFTLSNKEEEKTKEAKEKLQSVVDNARYTDLSTWSIKDSAQRVHNQLFRIVHLFKVSANAPAIGLFTETIECLPEIDCPVFPTHSYSEPVLSSICSNFASILETDRLENLSDGAISFQKLLEQPPNYCEVEKRCQEEGKKKREEIEEEQRKLYGRELHRRLQSLNALIKCLVEYGLNLRLPIESEKITELCLIGVDYNTDPDLRKHIPPASRVRNVAIKSLLKPSPHLQRQLPVKQLTSIHQILEVGISFILKGNNNYATLLRKQEKILSVCDYLSRLIDISKCKESWRPNHSSLCCQLRKSIIIFDDVKSEIAMLKKYVSARPETVDATEYDGVLNAVGAATDANMASAVEKISNLDMEIGNIGNKLVQLVEHEDNTDWIWKLESLEFLCDFAKNTIPVAKQNIESVGSLLGPLSERLALRFALFDETIKTAVNLLDERSLEYGDLDIHSIKMSIQSIYRATELANQNGRNPMDKLTKFIKTLLTMDFAEKQITEYATLLMNGGASSTLTESLSVLTLLRKSLFAVLDQTKSFFEHLIHVYVKLSVAFHLMAQKGIVEPIPRPERSVEEGNDGTDRGDATGMGEGSGEKNVSDEIEETGQLEGLEGENEESGDAGTGPQNEEGTIEMEEDIHGDIEGVDGNEKGEDEDEGPEDNAEELADWDTGDVEEPEETQLDPKLWDKEEDKTNKNLDEGTEGVNEKDNELAAGEKSELAASEIDEKMNTENADDDAEGAEGEEEEEHFENVNEMDVDEDEEDDTNQTETEETKKADNEEEIEEIEEGENMETEEAEVNKDLEAEEKPGGNEAEAYGNSLDNETNAANDKNGAAETDQAADKDTETGVDSGQENLNNAGASATSDMPLDEAQNNGEKEEESEKNAEMSRLICDRTAFESLMNANDVDEEMPSSSEVPPTGTEEKFSHIQNDDLQFLDRKTIHKGTVEESAASRSLMDTLDIQSMRPPEKTQSEPTKRQDYTAEPVHLSEPHMNISAEFKYASAEFRKDDDALLKTIEDLRGLSFDLHSKWELISDSVSADAIELAEALRLIIDPSVASKLQGDYRTGKRLNMRRLIPYIASNYRKDRIWMRRTKLSERNYQICLAVDDSGSMKDNMMTEITCQTVCLLEKAFQLLSIGEISIGKFGVNVEMLSKFGDSLSAEELGMRLLNSLTFEQKKTDIVKMLNSMRQYFSESRFASSRIPSHQLLIVVGDGRGALDNGAERVRSAIGGLLDDGVVTLYLAVDNPNNSIFNIKTMCRKPGAPIQLVDYMKMFPFPFYTVVQSSSAVPRAVGDSIRQWLDMSNGR